MCTLCMYYTKSATKYIFISQGICPGKGTNRNEALHRWLNNLFNASKIGVRLAYALLMIVFDKMNHKEDTQSSLLEKDVVNNSIAK